MNRLQFTWIHAIQTIGIDDCNGSGGEGFDAARLAETMFAHVAVEGKRGEIVFTGENLEFVE